FPEIQTYMGQGIDDAVATVRFDVTPAGFHAQVLSPRGRVFVEPYSKADPSLYMSYYTRDYPRPAVPYRSLTRQESSDMLNGPSMSEGTGTPGRGERRTTATLPRVAEAAGGLVETAAPPPPLALATYRLAVGATGEYTQTQGGTKTG